MYVIKCVANTYSQYVGCYVAKAVSGGSYTRKISMARKYSSIDEAEGHKCENEIVVSLESEVN